MRRHGHEITTALLLSGLLLAGPAAGSRDRGDGGGRGQGKQRVERVEKQNRAQQRQERRQARAAAQQRRVVAQQQRVVAQQRRALAQQQRASRLIAQRDRLRVQRVEALRDRDARLERERLRRVNAVQRRAVAPLRQRPVGPMRFRGLDRDGDGRVARWEWRGNDVSFRNHDWDRNGVLSGLEVVPGAKRPRTQRALERQRLAAVWGELTPAQRRAIAQQPTPRELRAFERQRVAAEARRPWFERQRWLPWRDPLRLRRDRLVVAPVAPVVVPLPLPPLDDAIWLDFDQNRFERAVRVHDFGPVDLIVSRVDLTPVDRVLMIDRFAVLDRDRDRFLSRNEWTGPRPLFVDLDRDDDELLVVDDFLVARDRLEPVLAVDRQRYVAFHLLDVDDDGVLAPWEWTGDVDLFFLLDDDNDAVVEQAEYLGLARARHVPLRAALGGDLDDDGRLVAVEWVGDPYRFARLDLDEDGEIEPVEAFVGWLMRA